MKKTPKIRKGQKVTRVPQAEFEKRYQQMFYDPNFSEVRAEIEKITQIAWENYTEGRKSPKTRPAGPGYKNPDYELSDEWRAASETLKRAERQQKSSKGKTRILIINGSPRNEHTCAGEVSKSFRLSQSVTRLLEAGGAEVDFIDLSLLTAEIGKVIHPCKACVSTSMPLCHWPCSCYPNHSLRQSPDWMNEIYEKWVLAHGIMILTPVHWYQVPSTLKLMIDRLVCADGGNPDPSSTKGKHPGLAKAIELKGWDFPKHLAGRAYSVVVHGDSVGAETVQNNLSSWLDDMQLVAAPPSSQVAGYIGYMESYAESHDAYDKSDEFRKRTLNAADGLLKTATLIRKKMWPAAKIEQHVKDPNPK